MPSVMKKQLTRTQIAFLVGIIVIVLLVFFIPPVVPTGTPHPYKNTSLLLESLKRCIVMYAKDHCSVPKGDATEVVSLFVDQGYLHMVKDDYGPDGKVVDGWNNPIVLTSHNGTLIVYSYGPDGEDDGGDEDDITYVVDPAGISADETEKQ